MKFIERPIVDGTSQPFDLMANIVSRRDAITPNIFSFQDINPFELPDMRKAVDLLSHAKAEDLTVGCVVDYDADGICSGAILREGLSNLGINVGIMVTDRHEDGYGFSNGTCNKLLAMEELPDIIITADLGSSDGVEIKRFQDEALKRGKKIPVIVTDHHHISKTTPPSTAEAFINPNRMDVFHVFDYPICGAGVAWMLVDALARTGLSHFNSHSLLDLVAIATIGDMVSLSNSVNRILVRNGLSLINEGSRQVWRDLLDSLNKKELREADIAFQVVPRINALSRMADDGQTALTWLTSEDSFASMAAYQSMQINNEERKDEQMRCQELALSQAKTQVDSGMYICVCYVPEFTHGVVGLAASHVVKETGLPAIVISVKDSGGLTASGRSIPGFDLRLAIERAQEDTGVLNKFGGHAMAAGLSIKSVDDIAVFHSAINAIAGEAFSHNQPEPIFYHDGELPNDLLDVDQLEHLETLGPFGQNYPAPAYLVKGLVTGVKLMGVEFQHAKITLSSGKELIWFHHEGKANEASVQIMEFVVSPSINEWRGKRSVQLIVQAGKIAG